MAICHRYWTYEIANNKYPDFTSFEKWMEKLPSSTALIYKYSFSPPTFQYWFSEEEINELNDMKLKGDDASRQ